MTPIVATELTLDRKSTEKLVRKARSGGHIGTSTVHIYCLKYTFVIFSALIIGIGLIQQESCVFFLYTMNPL